MLLSVLQAAALTAVATPPTQTPAPSPSVDPRRDHAAERLALEVARIWKQRLRDRPPLASSIGVDDHASELPDVSPGALEGRAERARADAALHDAVLENGTVPLRVLRSNVEDWIERQS